MYITAILHLWRRGQFWHVLSILTVSRMFLVSHKIINRPGVAGAVLQTALSLIKYFSDSSFVKKSLWRHHALMVGNGAFSHNIDLITIFRRF